MIETERPTLPEPRSSTLHRYQVYRQARNGVHYSHGESVASRAAAVRHFLHAAPIFEGGGLHLWDHREQCAIASAAWDIETTRFGFPVHTRENVFHNPTLAVVAHEIVEREQLEETIAHQIRMTA